jgi:hypothetical protein
MDWGQTNPTAVLAWAIDYDGNVIVYDELYVDDEPMPHMPSDVAPMLIERRRWWHREGARVVNHADPSVFNSAPMTKWGRPPSVADEFASHGLHLTPAVNDRVAGYVRLAELFKVDDAHTFPDWHERRGETGAPRAFIFRRCTHLIEQIQGAPLETLGEPHPGEAVSRKWEGPYGHAHAAARYGAMSWPGPSEKPDEPLEDGRAEWLRQQLAERDKPRRTNYQQV